MRILRMIKALIPVSRKTFEEANEYYATMIEGLVLSDAQHTQMENALMRRIESNKCEKNTKTSKKTDEAYQ